MNYESEKTEFKLIATDDIYKEVIAFANTEGGEIYVGIDDNGQAVGLGSAKEIDNTYNKITNGVRDSINPDVTMFIKYSFQGENSDIIKISVAEGTGKPYYLKTKGIKPGGVYVRQGASSAPASYEQIRQMIKDNDGNNYEDMRSLFQDLTFDSTKKAFKANGVVFSQEKYIALGLINKSNELYTSLAELLSDQCRHTIKVAVFDDESNTVFLDSKEFGGSLLQQLQEAYDYLNLCNKNTAVIEGLIRQENMDYPPEALREALLNCVVHRDYSYSGSIIININHKEIEFISIGGLMPGLTEADIKNGISQPRNRRLAEVFHRLGLIEAYGTGIRRIFTLYKACSLQPHFVVTPNTFKLVLPNMNYVKKMEGTRDREALTGLSPQKQKVLDYINKKEKITQDEIGELLGVKRTRAYTIAKELANMGLILPVGKGADKYYILSNK